MALDYWAHVYFDNPGHDRVESDDFDKDDILRKWAEDDDEPLPDDFEEV